MRAGMPTAVAPGGTGCSSGTMSYRFTVGELAGRTGDIPLSRVGPAPSECR